MSRGPEERLRGSLRRAVDRRARAGLPSAETDSYRLLHGAADDAEGLFVDVYGHWLVAEFYADTGGEQESAWLDALAELPFEGVYLKRRPRQASRVRDAERSERAPAHAVRGVDAPPEFAVREGGASILVRLGDGLATGIYLDQRLNRAELRLRSQGARVLNLFAYTCAFGLSAALGGAEQTCNVDLSKQALEWGKRNYEANGLTLDGHLFWARDVLQVLRSQRQKGERYDLIVLDPPSFARSRKGTLRVERDYASLVEQCAELVSPRGQLLACCNLRTWSASAFEAQVRAGVKASAVGRAHLEASSLGDDFPPPELAEPHMKSLWAAF